MSVLECLVAIIAIIVIGLLGMTYLGFKYGKVSYKDENTTVESKKSK